MNSANILQTAKTENAAALKRIAGLAWRLIKALPWRKMLSLAGVAIVAMIVVLGRFLEIMVYAFLDACSEPNHNDSDGENSEYSDASFTKCGEDRWYNCDGKIVEYETAYGRVN